MVRICWPGQALSQHSTELFEPTLGKWAHLASKFSSCLGAPDLDCLRLSLREIEELRVFDNNFVRTRYPLGSFRGQIFQGMGGVVFQHLRPGPALGYILDFLEL